jgi:hypothetical protein
MSLSRTDENGLANAAQEMLKQISSQNPEVLEAQKNLRSLGSLAGSFLAKPAQAFKMSSGLPSPGEETF